MGARCDGRSARRPPGALASPMLPGGCSRYRRPRAARTGARQAREAPPSLGRAGRGRSGRARGAVNHTRSRAAAGRPAKRDF